MGNIIDNVKRQTQQLKNDVTRSGGIYYKGTLNKTQSGRQCQRWVDQWPHGHSRTPWNYPGKGLGAHNYCRNPDGEPQIWCYTNDRNSRWEFCNTNTAKQMIENDGNTKIRKIVEQHIKPLEKMEDNYTKKLDKISQNYNNLNTEIHSIMNNDNTGIRDKLMSEDKYKSYLSTELEKSKDASDIRIEDTKTLIEHNNSVFNLGVITASTLLVAGIVVARE